MAYHQRQMQHFKSKFTVSTFNMWHLCPLNNHISSQTSLWINWNRFAKCQSIFNKFIVWKWMQIFDKKKVLLFFRQHPFFTNFFPAQCFFFPFFVQTVPPLIRVRNQYLYAFEGGSVSLECEVSVLQFLLLNFHYELQYYVSQSNPSMLSMINKPKTTCTLHIAHTLFCRQ